MNKQTTIQQDQDTINWYLKLRSAEAAMSVLNIKLASAMNEAAADAGRVLQRWGTERDK